MDEGIAMSIHDEPPEVRYARCHEVVIPIEAPFPYNTYHCGVIGMTPYIAFDDDLFLFPDFEGYAVHHHPWKGRFCQVYLVGGSTLADFAQSVWNRRSALSNPDITKLKLHIVRETK